jgi:hypothetical protein
MSSLPRTEVILGIAIVVLLTYFVVLITKPV